MKTQAEQIKTATDFLTGLGYTVTPPKSEFGRTHPKYPPGSFVRAEQICGNPKKNIPGLLPVSEATWWRWVKDGRVPAGRKLGPQVTAWPIEVVLAVSFDGPTRNLRK